MLGKNHFAGNGFFFNNIYFLCLSLYSEISLLVAESFGILRFGINGSTLVTLTQFDATALNFYIGLDYDYRYYIFDVLGLSAKTWYTFVGTILYTILILVSKPLLWDGCLLMGQHRPRIYLWCNMEQLVCSLTWYHNNFFLRL